MIPGDSRPRAPASRGRGSPRVGKGFEIGVLDLVEHLHIAMAVVAGLGLHHARSSLDLLITDRGPPQVGQAPSPTGHEGIGIEPSGEASMMASTLLPPLAKTHLRRCVPFAANPAALSRAFGQGGTVYGKAAKAI